MIEVGQVKRAIMKLAPIAIGLLATASLASPAFARGGVLHLLHAARNPEHLRGFPAEVRNALAHNHSARCTQASCLHQVYTSTGGRYRLLRSYYASDH